MLALRRLRDDYAWDLADICLAQHTHVLEKMRTVVSRVEAEGVSGVDAAGMETMQSFMPDSGFIDAMFPSIWDWETLQYSTS